MTEQTMFERARWLRDFARFLPLKSQFVLSGNVRDLQIVETAPGEFAAVPLVQAVQRELKAAEYSAALTYDLVSGFGPIGSSEGEITAGRQAPSWSCSGRHPRRRSRRKPSNMRMSGEASASIRATPPLRIE